MKYCARLAAILVTLLGLAACIVEPVEETETGRMTLAVERILSEREARALFEWFVTQGIDPCDPPPDPWSPFAIYGYCATDCDVE